MLAGGGHEHRAEAPVVGPTPGPGGSISVTSVGGRVIAMVPGDDQPFRLIGRDQFVEFAERIRDRAGVARAVHEDQPVPLGGRRRAPARDPGAGRCWRRPAAPRRRRGPAARCPGRLARPAGLQAARPARCARRMTSRPRRNAAVPRRTLRDRYTRPWAASCSRQRASGCQRDRPGRWEQRAQRAQRAQGTD